LQEKTKINGLDKLRWDIECAGYLNQETPFVRNKENVKSLDLNSKIKN
jgi:hypothetical protein